MSRSTLHGKVAAGVSRIATRVPGTGHRAAQGAGEREHRKLQDRYDALRAELESSERRRAELFSLLAHDLKNPLTPLLMSTQMLVRASPPDDPGRRSIDIVRRCADEISSAIDELSDASRIDQGQLPVRNHLAPADVRGMITEAVDATSRRAQDRRVEVTVADDLPPVCCDRHRIARVLVDLVIRALRITPRGGSVEIRAQRADDGATLLSVTDGGPAVPEEYRDAFFDLPTNAAHHRATGQEFALSLFVARGVVEAHGGWMDVQSDGERGNTVSLALPEGEPESD